MKFIKSKVVYKGKRVLLEETSYLDKSGCIKVIEHVNVKPAVVILAITKNNNIVFIKEKRTAIGNVDVLSLPAGLIEENEIPENAAIRELKEETGYEAKDLKLLTWYYSSCGFTNEKIYIYLADNLDDKKEQELDEVEEIDVCEIPKDEAFQMLEDGNINTASCEIALLWLKNFKEEL